MVQGKLRTQRKVFLLAKGTFTGWGKPVVPTPKQQRSRKRGRGRGAQSIPKSGFPQEYLDGPKRDAVAAQNEPTTSDPAPSLYRSFKPGQEAKSTPPIFRPNAPDMGKPIPGSAENEEMVSARLRARRQHEARLSAELQVERMGEAMSPLQLEIGSTPTGDVNQEGKVDEPRTPAVEVNEVVKKEARGGLETEKPATSVSAEVASKVAARNSLEAEAPQTTVPETEVVTKIIVPQPLDPMLVPKPQGSLIPESAAVAVNQYKRDFSVRLWVLQNARGICECCNRNAPFISAEGLPYLEVHHVRPLGENGSDTVLNTVALCPNCHREIHYGADRKEVVIRLYKSLSRLVQE